MHYYIYPKNWDGEDVALNLSKIEKEATFSFIDDSEPALSLDKVVNKIKNDKEGLVLIVSKYRYFDLEEKLINYGINNYVDGLVFCADKIDKYYKKYFLTNGNNCSVGLLVTQLPHSEHVRGIAIELENRSIPIVFFVTDIANYHEYQNKYKNSYVIIARCDLLEYIKCVSIMHVTSHYAKVHSSVISILNPQGLLDPVQNYFYFTKEGADSLIGSRVNFDYIFCHTKEMQKFYQSFLGSLAHPSKFVFVGYPSLDSYLQEIGNIDVNKSDKKTVIVAFTISKLREDGSDMSGINQENITQIITRLLQEGYKVIFRPHPESCKAIFMQNIIKAFKGNEGFIYDDTPRLSRQIMQEALTIIGNGSSIMQTFPLATKKPAVMFMPEIDFLSDNKSLKSLIVNPKLHLMAHSVDEIIKCLEKLQNGNEKYQDEILQYYKNNIDCNNGRGGGANNCGFF